MRPLNENKIPADDRRARFVGVKAYRAAGGSILRDLFDAEGGGFFTDAELLTRLANAKLDRSAKAIAAEGWQWVETGIEFNYATAAGMRRIHPAEKVLTDAERDRLAELEDRYTACAEDDDPDEATLEAPDTEIAALTEATAFDPADIARAGVFVSLDPDGDLRIERGFVRREDEPKPEVAAKERVPGPAGLSEKLIADLTSHRTAALRNELAQRPDLAPAATVHMLVLAIFYSGAQNHSCLALRASSASLDAHVSCIAEIRAGTPIQSRHAAWESRLPQDPATLWAFVLDLTQGEQLALLAHCAAESIDAIRQPGGAINHARDLHAALLADAMRLDMVAYWQLTVAGYLGRVSKERILEAVAEGVSADAARNMATMKKAAMAEAAEKRLAGKGWLPDLLWSSVPVAEHDEPFAQAAE